MTKYLDVAVRAAKKAGSYVMRHFDKENAISFKKGREIVTEIDKQSEKIIIGELLKAFPSHGVWSEERPELEKKSQFRWVVDPIDGTAIFTRGFPFFGIAIALERKGKPVVAVHYFPALKWLYTAEKGKGAYCNGERIHVSKNTKKDPLIYLVSTELLRHPRLMSPFMREARERKVRPEAYGSTAFHISMVAHGRADASFDFHVKPGDIAAGILLVEEAGGRVTDRRGKKATSAATGVISSNGKFHRTLTQQ